MTQNLSFQQSTGNLSQNSLQNLIAMSTGFVDVYDIYVHGDSNILLPQNMILAAMSATADSTFVEWHEKQLPVYNVCSPNLTDVIALVVGGETEQMRFAILCDQMPNALKLRVSQVKDIEMETPQGVYQYVQVDDEQYQIPNISYLQKLLFD